MKLFADFGVCSEVQDALNQNQIFNPTPIQELAIPIAMSGKDILGSAQTGTGKTLAFLVPIMEKLMADHESTALILTPTREIAKQVFDTIVKINKVLKRVPSALIIGGESMMRQMQDLKRKPRLIIGTPGRINDHLNRRSINLRTVSMLILDETDRMLDMGFSEQIDAIIEHIPAERQILMFSATMSKPIIRVAQKYLNDPERIAVGSVFSPTENVTQEVKYVTSATKDDILQSMLSEIDEATIIFMKTKRSCDDMKDILNDAGFEAEAIHGDLPQRRREKVIHQFRNDRFKILVATDVAARGIDIPQIKYVINYDLPTSPEDYIHRIGRTGRAGTTGASISFLCPDDKRRWKDICDLIEPDKRFSFDHPLGSAPSNDKRGSKSSRGGRSPRSNDSYSREGFPRRSEFKKEGFSRSSSEDRRSSDRPFSDRKPSDRPFSDRKPSDRKFGDRKPSDRPFSDRKPSDRPFSDRKPSDRPFSDRKPSDRPFSDRKPSDRPFSDRKPSDRPFSDRKPSDRPFSDRKPSDRKFGDRKPSDRPFSDRKPSDRKFGDKKKSNFSGGRAA
ncbi:MAG: ATP-dependent RNA helicase [Candidatus Puniceispirillum sp.]|nr:ATP-dependent RNA helicase [Candidatus Pelagibacter sp.]MBA4283544.1 ATP-dependent RNA helicase [Candidatus Puniceispirillum sp.]